MTSNNFFLLIILRILIVNAVDEIINAVSISTDSNQNAIFFEIVEPPELEYTYKIKPAKDFGARFNASFFERRIGLVPVQPLNGCQSVKNAVELRGNVALVERGECSFFTKAVYAEEAGAKAVIIFDEYPSNYEEMRDTPLWLDHFYIEMIKGDEIDDSITVNIPAGFLHGKNGRMILNTLNRLKISSALINIPVNITHTDTSELHQPPWISW